MSEEQTVKQCCARAYESDFAKYLFGDSFHPGGVKLTERLGTLLGLSPQFRVLDIASGKGTSALFLAKTFGCEVLGIDYGGLNVEEANASAKGEGLNSLVSFRQGDAERLPVADSSFDAIICECAFCTFPGKTAAAGEFARVLRSGGRVGLSDLTRVPVLPKELDGLLAWVACIADAQPLESYVQYLSDAGFRVEHMEQHDEALVEMVNKVRMKLLGAEIMIGLKKLELPGADLPVAKQMAQAALAAVQQGRIGYALLCGSRS